MCSVMPEKEPEAAAPGTKRGIGMNETVRVTSTARKISRAWFWRLVWIFFKLNLILTVLAALSFCYAQEKAALGSDWTPALERSLNMPVAARGDHFWDSIRNFYNALEDAHYVFYGPDGARYSAACAPFFALFRPNAAILLTLEGLMLLGQVISGRRKARLLLRPLDRMARAARELGRIADLSQSPIPERDEEKLHDLQDAIQRIRPDKPEERLDMGDQDLEGLQDAINGLLSRMHESYRRQAQFVSDASHELRTPIAVIQGYAGMLDRWGKQDEKILDESIAAIKGEAGYMNKLVEQLLFLARGDTGRNRLELAEIDLGELMKQVYEDSLLIDHSHDWRIDVHGGVRCVGDANMLKQCARILTDNALKYTPERGIISLRAFENEAGECCMEVQDSGIGIAPADLPHVFDRFYRSDPARGRSSGGAGLGLSIAKWIVERHGGHIELLSREGLGTRMRVCLPRGRLAEEA